MSSIFLESYYNKWRREGVIKITGYSKSTLTQLRVGVTQVNRNEQGRGEMLFMVPNFALYKNRLEFSPEQFINKLYNAYFWF